MASQSETAGEILAALRGDKPAEVAHPGEPPSTRGMNEEAAAKVIADYEKKLDAHVAHLLSKPSGTLTAAEQATLMRGLAQWDKGGRG